VVHVAHEEHHVADFDGRGALVDRCGLVDARLGVPGVHGAAVDVHGMLAADLQAHGQAVGVDAADAARAVHGGVDESRVLRDGCGVAVEVGIAFDAPHHFTQGRALFHRGRQARLFDAATITLQPLRHSKTSSSGASDFSARPQSSKNWRHAGRSSAP
jgi:hypothetical protein